MARFKHVQPVENNDNTHRWLVSYADYMTLMFALFVVMYAMAIIEEEKFTVISDTISGVFQSAAELSVDGNGVSGEGLLNSNEPQVDSQLYGISINHEEKGPELVDGDRKSTRLNSSH